MPVPLQNFLAWSIVSTFFHFVAFGMTGYRLCLSFNRLEDFVIAFALLLTFWYLGVVWTNYTVATGAIYATETRISLYWMCTVLPITIGWLTRISMVLTIARILPLVQNRLKFLVRGIAVGFVLIWVLVIGYQMGLCISDEAWHHSPAMVCSAVGWIIGVVTDTVALNVLLALPIYFLFYIRVLQSVESRHTALMIIVANAITGVFGFGAIPFVIGGAALGPGSPTVAGYMAPINIIVGLATSNLVVLSRRTDPVPESDMESVSSGKVIEDSDSEKEKTRL